MVFLKVYFCACTVFLNNVPISTGKDKPRAAQNLLGHRRSVAAWGPLWARRSRWSLARLRSRPRRSWLADQNRPGTGRGSVTPSPFPLMARSPRHMCPRHPEVGNVCFLRAHPLGTSTWFHVENHAHLGNADGRVACRTGVPTTRRPACSARTWPETPVGIQAGSPCLERTSFSMFTKAEAFLEVSLEDPLQSLLSPLLGGL